MGNLKYLGVKPLKEANLIKKFLNRFPKENAIIEISNLLATTEDLKKISPKHITAIGEKYNVDIFSEFQSELQEIFANYLKYCLRDNRLSDEEVFNLRCLQRLFYINASNVKRLQQQVCQELYAKNVEQAVSDGYLDTDEEKQLERLQKYFQITDEDALRLYETEVKKVVTKYLEGIYEEGELSPDKEKQFLDLADNLKTNINFDDKNKAAFDMLRMFWQIENGELPEYNVDIFLPSKEICHFRYPSVWLEYRKVTKRIRYGGPTLRIKIARGIYWRAGDLGIQAVSEDILTRIDTGSVFITNKKILFKGEMKNLSIPLNKIIDFAFYKNGVEIQKNTGKNIFFQLDEDISVKLFSMTLGRLLRDL